MDYSKHCRTCLGSNNDMRSIQSSYTIVGDTVCLTDILKDFYKYEVSEDDNLSGNICISCVHQLIMTYSFKCLIESSSRTLLNSLNTNESYIECTTDDDYHYEDHKPKKREMQNYRVKRRKQVKEQQKSTEKEWMERLFCVECKTEFQSSTDLLEHCNRNHPPKSIIGRDCNHCNEKFEDFRSLVLHRKLHSRPYLCEHCWDGFYEEQELQRHSCEPNRHKQKDKHKTEKSLQQCDQCGKSYPPGYIRIHMLTHSNDRPYSCKFCPKKFKVPGGLHSHVLWNHKRTRNHKCEVCNATFISSSSRSSHIRKNHLKEKKYSCESCGKRFFSKSELQRHSLTHTGVKNFHCHLCDKSYQTRYGLNVHLKSHSQSNSDVCGI